MGRGGEGHPRQGVRGVVDEALTTFEQGMGNWFIRGNLAVDSSAVRVFAARSEITSCDLPVPDYHFAAKEVKWVSRSLLVARPAVLYVRDVPIAWIPFVIVAFGVGEVSMSSTGSFAARSITAGWRRTPGPCRSRSAGSTSSPSASRRPSA